MNHALTQQGRTPRRHRIRARLRGSAARPRLSIFRSLRALSAQVIDDDAGRTLVAACLAEMKNAKNSVDGAKAFGTLIAKKCAAKKITTVVFDRGGYKYHGKVKAFADGARSGGLTF